MTRTALAPLHRLQQRFRRNAADCVRIDPRSLAVFRVFVGLLVIADVLLRSRNFHFYYTDDGAVPRALAMEFTPETAFSIFHLTTNSTAILALFALGIAIACQLIVGYETRLASILTFAFVLSLDLHNPFVLSHADTLFRLLLFWAMFLPLGERWSIDAVHRDRPPRESVASVATALILCQMVFMYFRNGYHKYQSELWMSGDATPLIFGLDDMTFLLAGTLREFPGALRYLGTLWFVMLLCSWLLLVLRGRPRLLLVGLFAGGHASFAVTVRIGAFAYVALAGLVLFLQARFWEDGAALLRYLGLHERLSSRFREFDRRARAVAEAVPRLRIRSPVVRTARGHLYALALGAVVVSFVLLPATSFALAAAGVDADVPAEERADEVASSLGVSQPQWTVFAPNPRTTDRYYVFAAETEDGERVDVYNDRALTRDRPHHDLEKQYGTYRERFYMNSVRRGSDDNRSKYLAEHLCREWAEERDTELKQISMYVVSESVTMGTITVPEDRDKRFSRFATHGCGDDEPRVVALPAD